MSTEYATYVSIRFVHCRKGLAMFAKLKHSLFFSVWYLFENPSKRILAPAREQLLKHSQKTIENPYMLQIVTII